MKRVVGWVGVPAVLAGVVVAWGAGGAAVAADAPEVQSSLVEDYAYPGAEQILAEHGLRLFTGDGHVEFVPSTVGPCATGLVMVEAVVEDELAVYCFRTSGVRGFLTMEVPNTFVLRGGSKPVEATAQLPGEVEETYKVPVNTSVPVEPGDGQAMPEAILVELRFGTW